MPKSKIFEGKTTNEAIEKGLKEFHTKKEKVDIRILDEDKRSFFSILEPRKVKIEMILKEDNENRVKKENTIRKDITKEEIEEIEKEVDKFVKEFISVLPTKEIEYSVKYEENYVVVDINGESLNYLIGYRGDVLNSIQTILTTFVTSKTEAKVKVILDICNYKEKRKQTLENLAERTANNVIKKRRQITLEPMQAYERKIIHAKLQENNKVKTYSIGEEPYRKIVIAPK